MIATDFNNDGYQSVLVANTGYNLQPYPGQNNSMLSNDGTGLLVEQKGDTVKIL